MKRLAALVIVAGMTFVGLVAVGGPAPAAFPGPDGRIAFITDTGGCCNISTMNPDGSDVTQLTHVASGTGAFDPFWSPDGTAIVFDLAKFGRTFRSQIWVMNADGSGQHRLLTAPFFVDYFPSYSPDGTRIVFNRCRPDFESCAIYRINADGTGLTAITPFKISVQDVAPRYSPDGATIAFNGNGRRGVRLAVYLMNADGSNVRRLTPAGLGAFAPDWAPDGSRIVFSTHCCGLRQPTAIWAINVDKTGLHELTFPGQRHDFAPSYAPSGDKIAFERDSSDFSHFSVWVMNPDGTGVTKIRGNSGAPQWGPVASGGTTDLRATRTAERPPTHERKASCVHQERLAVFPLLRFWRSCSH
jgi:Tol biopolymer transport system component